MAAQIPRIVGIVNITPDSFSDGGCFMQPAAALARVEALLAEGADVVDFGAESTRPGARPLSSAEEWERLEAVLQHSRKQFPDAIFSVDTRHSETAARALDNGIDWINDVSGAADEAMLQVVARHPQSRYVLMHALSIPADPAHTLPPETDVVPFMQQWFLQTYATLQAAGISNNQIIFDPGIGFGKTAEQSWQLLRGTGTLAAELDAPLLVGHSRKSFLKTITSSEAVERDLETHIISAALAHAGVAFLRVHDVAGTRRALAVAKALKKE